MPDWDRKPGFDLTGRKAIVVGFGTPAGHAIALALAEAGADVATASATLDGDEVMAAKRASKAIANLGRATFSQGWDVTLPTNVQVGLRQVAKEFGSPSILVYNADAFLAKSVESVSDSEFGRLQQVNASGGFYAARSFAKQLEPGTPGRIVYITSILAERGTGWNSAYTATKGGVLGLVAGLSQELAPRGITTTAIATGWMDWTPGRGPDAIGDNKLMRYIPMRRLGTPEDVAPLAVLLASDGGGYLNGQVFHVDGGVSQHL